MYKESTTPKKIMLLAGFLVDKGYSMGHQVGEGTYSKVRTVERRKDGNILAVKIVELSKVRTDYVTKFMPRELETVLTLKHKNVIQTFEIFKTKDFVFQIMQYAEKGDVLQMIHSFGRISENRSKKIFHDVAKGIQYMHGKNIAHRDLKCENILLFKDNSAAISDFGFVRNTVVDKREIKCQTFCGSHAYASPELLRGIPYDPKINDIWSMGVILFTMLSGTMPFDDSNLTRMVQKQLRKDITFPQSSFGNLTDTCKQFVMSILEPSVDRRISIDRMFETKWMKASDS